MADYAPPPGPPPPKVPEGWKAVWNDQYKEWFYVNTITKQSQWEKPSEPLYAAPGDAPSSGAPPGYDHSSSRPTGPEKTGLGSNNPYNGSGSHMTDDEQLARQLQAEEEARARAGGSSADRGASDSYYGGPAGASPYGQPANPYGQQQQQQQPPYGQAQEADRGKKGGLFSKISSKLGGGSSRPPQGYGGYPPQGYPPQGYGGYPPQGYGGYPPQGGYYAQQPPRRQGGGMGAAGGAALGLGGGLIGGMLLENAIDDHEQDAYQDGYQDGADQGGGDMGGDDGGDMGGDF